MNQGVALPGQLILANQMMETYSASPIWSRAGREEIEWQRLFFIDDTRPCSIVSLLLLWVPASAAPDGRTLLFSRLEREVLQS